MMRRVALMCLMLNFALLAGSGCALRRSRIDNTVWYDGSYATVAPGEDRITRRGTIAAEVDQVPAIGEVRELLGRGVAPNEYLALTAEQCQCRAAANATLAALIELERQFASQDESAAGLKTNVLALRAEDERNRAAGKALELFYQLAEAEAGRDALAQSIVKIDKAIKDYRSLKEKGLPVSGDEIDMQQQRIELLKRQAETQLAIEKLNGGLHLLLGSAGVNELPIWPEADLNVILQPLDAEEAVGIGSGTRADLALLRSLFNTLDTQSLPSVRNSLRQEEFSLGNPASPLRGLRRILGGANTEAELGVRRVQLMRLLADQERAVAQEIRSAVASVHASLEQIAIAKELHERRAKRLADLKELRGIDRATAFDISTAELELIDARFELVRRVIAWRAAEAKLKESQGLLAVECGFGMIGDGHAHDGYFCNECLVPAPEPEMLEDEESELPMPARPISSRNHTTAAPSMRDGYAAELLRAWREAHQHGHGY